MKGCNLRLSGLDPEAHANDVNKQFLILRQCDGESAKEKVIQEKEKVIQEREMELQRKDNKVKQKMKEIDGWKKKVDAEAMKMVAANQRINALEVQVLRTQESQQESAQKVSKMSRERGEMELGMHYAKKPNV